MTVKKMQMSSTKLLQHHYAIHAETITAL